MAELGWLDYLEGEGFQGRIHLPKPVTVRELALYVKEKMNLNAVRYVGNPDAMVQNIAFGGHMCFGPEQDATRQIMNPAVDVVIPGEVIDWTAMSYARDAAQQGRNKAILNVGHISWEELGMKWMVNWLRPLVGADMPITFVPSADLYSFIQ